jgi:hypothetical protein
MRNGVLLVAFFLAPSIAEAKDCPSNPIRASTAVWSAGSIPPGRTVKLTRFRGHPTSWVEGVHDVEAKTTLPS